MMKMNEFMTALQTHLATQQPNYPDNAESILEVLFDAYNESSGFDNAAIKADFEELYRLMNGKTLKEIDEIIYAVCTLCRDHERLTIKSQAPITGCCRKKLLPQKRHDK